MRKFQIALVNVFWSENDINTRYFESVADQTAYFEELTRGNFSPLVNFNMGNNIETAVTYVDKSNRPVSELIACNYAVVQEVEATQIEGSRDYVITDIISSRYFFAYPSQDSGRQMRVTLSLDDIQTNYIKHRNTISPCLIRRANLNRWVDNGDDTFSFNGNENSPLYIDELNSVGSKRLISRYPLVWKHIPNNETLNDWLNEYVAYWVYIFIDKTKNFKGYTQGGSVNNNIEGILFRSEIKTKNSVGLTTGLKTDYGILAYPVFKKAGTINVIYENNTYKLSEASETTFEANNNDTSYIYTKKASLKCPFKHLFNSQFAISGTTLNIYQNTTYSPDIVNPYLASDEVSCRVFFSDTNKCLLSPVFQEAKPLESKEIDLSEEFPLTFTKSDIMNGTENSLQNPKRRSFENYSLTMKAFEGSTFEYDIQKLNTNKFTFLYDEVIQAEITKFYVRIKPSGLYTEGTKENFLGIVGSTDMTFSVSNDQWQNYLANNKNFWLQSSFKLIGDAIGTVGHSALAGSEKGIKGGVATAGFNIVSDMFNTIATYDNMKEAPDSLKQSSGNLMFTSNLIELTIYIEIHKVLDCVLENKNDFNILYGFAYDRIGKVEDFDNIRHIYNYIEADVENISAPISNLEKQRLKQKLKSVRFWKTDRIDYSNKNYEEFLTTIEGGE